MIVLVLTRNNAFIALLMALMIYIWIFYHISIRLELFNLIIHPLLYIIYFHIIDSCINFDHDYNIHYDYLLYYYQLLAVILYYLIVYDC